LIFLAAGGSAAMLLGAWGFQFLGFAPCQMCIWQRWPHGIAVVIGVIAVLVTARPLLLLGALAALTTGGIGIFHTGVERGWWEGITECAGTTGILETPIDDLLNPNIDAGPPLVRCDEVAWEFLALSMARAILSTMGW